MSSEIILDENVLNQEQRVKHGPQHDLESFFWVLCWLATHFIMPGCMRAREDIPRIVLELFSEEIGPQMMAMKKTVFWHRHKFDTIAKGITPYFRPLEGTLKLWMETLYVFYEEAAARTDPLPPDQPPVPPTIPQELLHAIFLEALSRVDGVVVNDDMDDQYKEARRVELERRRVDLLPLSASRKRKVTREQRMDVDG
jgi:hypothetical protein